MDDGLPKQFCYFDGGDHHQCYAYQPGMIIAGLAQSTRHSLAELHITGAWIGIRTSDIDILDLDLHVFEKLECHRVDHTLLNNNKKPCLARCNEEFRDCDCHPLRLVEVLPVSMKATKLKGEMTLTRSRVILAALPKLKSKRHQRLPNLYKIEIQGPAASDQHLIRALKAVGVTLTHVEEVRRRAKSIVSYRLRANRA